MREQIKDAGQIEHIAIAINYILSFVKNKTKEDFQTDKMLFFSVVKNLEIIGEAAYKLTNEFKESHPDIPWKLIIGMRHVLVHDYYNIDEITAWNTVQDCIIPLQHQITAILNQEN